MRININNKNINAKINLDRFDRQFLKAQKQMDAQVLADSNSFAPFQQGALRSSGHIEQAGVIVWDAPYAHYQYHGTLLTDEYGRTYVGKGETKPIDTGIPLNYHEPNTGAEWFETAKEKYKRDWIKQFKKTAGGN